MGGSVRETAASPLAPARSWGARCQPRALCPAWGPVCTRLCFLSRRPLSRCGLLGKGACAAACDKESGPAGGGAGTGWGGLQPGVPDFERANAVFRATMKSTLLLSEERQVKSKALSLQPLYLLLTVPCPGTFAEGGWCPAGAREELRPRLWPHLRPGRVAGGPLPVPWWLCVIQPLPRKDSRRPPTSSEARPWGGGAGAPGSRLLVPFAVGAAA